ncbi:MAG: hypothetical protein H6Q75_1122, partial [Firmicutes bacterium]|nr:hypothetical protein [Bacillota bacterium]
LARAGRTDTGLGLKKAWELVTEDTNSKKKCLVVLTDGEIDLGPLEGQRSVELYL